VRGPVVAGEPAAVRLMRQLDYRLHPDAAPISPAQVAVVLHALADHTALMAALEYRRPDDSPWPESVSLGRWLHDAGDQAASLPDPTAEGDTP
jgi:hypothetical protein